MTQGREISVKGSEQMKVFRAANTPKPKAEDLKAMNKMLDENPRIWQDIGNLSKNIEAKVLDQHYSGSALLRESYRRTLSLMRDNLGWETSTEIEKVLIEQICMNWLRHHFMEAAHLEKTSQSHSIETGLYWDKILSSAQKRYLRACESLAKVRKLLAEANLRDEQARNKRSKSTLISQQILKNATS